MKAYFVIFFAVLFTFNNWAKAQQLDTVFFDVPELKVNNNSFLHDLDTILQKHCYDYSGKKGSAYHIIIEQQRTYIYLLNVTETTLEYAKKNTKGFFKINNVCFFVKGILPENPKKLFTLTDNHQQFYYLEPVIELGELMIDIFDGFCDIALEYRYEKLFFFERDW